MSITAVSAALPRLRRMLVAPRQPSGRRDALSPASQVARWWAESEELSRRAIEDAIVELLQGVLRSRTPLFEPSQARLLLQLAQLVAELKLDERARTLLWSAAQHGRMSSDVAPLLPPDAEARLLGWMAVIQVPEWLPAWQRLWRSPHTDLWAVAYSAITNAAPDEASALLPDLLERRSAIGDETCAFLVHSLLQEGVAWASALGHWVEKGRTPNSVVTALDAFLSQALATGLAEPASEGLARLRTATREGPLPA